MTKDRKAYFKAYRQAHKEERKAYYQAHKEEIKAYQKSWHAAHKEERKAYYQAHKEEAKASMKAWSEANKDKCIVYKKSDVNSFGESKHNIRCKSRRILKKMNLNIPGYETHHCFTYDDPSKFLYISKSLHLKIHAYLKEHNIDADSDHWLSIRDMVLNCNEYFYAKM